MVICKLVHSATSKARIVRMSESVPKSPPKLSKIPSLRKLHFKDTPGTGKQLQISFGGCGFLGVYHVGVGKCVVDHAPHLFSEFDCFYGASAGSITAVCAACRSDPMIAYKWVRKTFDESRTYWFGMLNPFFDIYGRLRKFLDHFLPRNAHKLCRDMVKISLTVIGDNGLPKNWLVSDFRTRRELINIIIASSFIPGYAGFKNLPKIRGKRCCDGGFTSNIPRVSDPDVITVSPFAGFCDICPQRESCTQHMINICDQPMQLSPANFYRLAKSLNPSSWKELEDLYHQGYSDCLSFFRKEGLIPDPKIEKRKETPSPSSSIDSAICMRPCDPHGNGGGSDSRITSLTLSASGEFLGYFGGEKRDPINSIHWEEVERGLDLKGTEKATRLMRQYGWEEARHDLAHWFSEEKRGLETGTLSRIINPPVQIIRVSLYWLFQSCHLRELIPRKLSQCWPLTKLAENGTNDLTRELEWEEFKDVSPSKGFLRRLASSSVLMF